MKIIKFLRWFSGAGIINALWLASNSTQEKQIIALAGVAFYAFLVFYKMPIEAFILLSLVGFTASLGLNLMMFLSDTGCFYCFINLVVITILMLTGFMSSKISRLLKAAAVIVILALTWTSLVLVNDPITKMAFNISQGQAMFKGDCPCEKKGVTNAN